MSCFQSKFSQFVTSAATVFAALLVATAATPVRLTAQGYASAERGSVALANALNSLGNTSRVLVIGAHPDDEDTQLIAWLARGRHVETAYLSLTRGDGGQNLIGNELGEALGVIRTEELLAARRIDGGRQFFTRAFDFGFSKNAEETLQHWPKDTIMGDVVRVVRAFRPEVIVAVFSGTPRDGHGHHQVSGMLARDAYDASGDTIRFPVAAYGLPWTVSKFYRRVRVSDASPTTKMNVGEYDPLVGRSYAEIASDSRSQHKSQGFGVLQQKGVFIDQIGLEASRVSDVKNAASEKSIFDGIDTTWNRLRALSPRRDVKAALDSANALFTQARALYNANDPAPTVAPLAAIVRLLRVARDSAGVRPPRLLAGDDPLSRSRLLDSRGIDRAGLASMRARDPKYVTPVEADAELWNAANVNLQRAERALVVASGIAVEALAPRATLP
ncbi:MAG: PIG-L family deacetylase, partial [Gemmatimonadota bacterium]|nr:PIG-L family deacetylase [Gemmatimonadota bacterium]